MDKPHLGVAQSVVEGETETEGTPMNSEKLVQLLSQQYKGRVEIRKSYLRLFGFLLNFLLLITILSMQTSPNDEYGLLEGFREAYLPSDANGDPAKLYTSRDEIWEWLKYTVQKFWKPPSCGDGFCEDPLEFPSFGIYGCQADCGARNVTPMTVQLTVGRTGQSTSNNYVSWNVCPEEDDRQCWYEEDLRMAPGDTFVGMLYLPDAHWKVVALLETDTTLQVGVVETNFTLSPPSPPPPVPSPPIPVDCTHPEAK
ncbi:hypothetical protein CYMTET_4460, partial [Cymbomonas tetramitiformis]